MNMKKSIPQSTLNTLWIILGVIVVALIVMPYLGEKQGDKNTVKVQGQHSLEVNPDLMSVYLNVETKADSSGEAEQKNSEITENLTQAIVDLGFEEKDLKTENYNIRPEYEYDNGKREQVGYVASHSMKISFSANKTDLAGDIISSAADTGAGINYVSFELSQELQKESKSQAISRAAGDARIKAESLAVGFDKSVGKLKEVSLNEYNYQPWRVYDSAGGGEVAEDSVAKAQESVTNINPSEKEVKAYVTAVYELK